ncbi:MAG: TlpA family protein disulfide reductase [Deltaproteobacteria bacterium]|nr:TlpA family protein disulfide reductase [Deltaproteobacteria bacterium]MBW2594872.1 TlpA family protein disulfide reductase [Deltaproteobacteria bacterium]MBW2650285.1 TlpA family protein disulfide reductase [Deltaproteobacteria bacterium]
MALRDRRGYEIQLLLIVMLLASILMIVPFPAFSSQGEDVWKSSIEELAPDFVLKDLDGKEIRLADYRGKVVLLAFSTTWCPHCRKMPPYLNELRSKYGDSGLVIFNIDIQEPLKKVRSYAAKHDIKYRVLLDEKATVAKAYNVRGVPSLILVDKDGTIVCRQCRLLDVLLETLLPATQ